MPSEAELSREAKRLVRDMSDEKLHELLNGIAENLERDGIEASAEVVVAVARQFLLDLAESKQRIHDLAGEFFPEDAIGRAYWDVMGENPNATHGDVMTEVRERCAPLLAESVERTMEVLGRVRA